MLGAKKFPPNNFKEFLAYIKANKDKRTCGNAGLGPPPTGALLFMNAIASMRNAWRRD